MPWLPYFSNCNGHDSHIVIYDLLEYAHKDSCVQPSYDDIMIVSPIPSDGYVAYAD